MLTDISGDIHAGKKIKGKYLPDGKGAHLTISYKTQEHLGRGTHITAHAYIFNSITMKLRQSCPRSEKEDSTLKPSGKAVWPTGDEIREVESIAYSHLENE